MEPQIRLVRFFNGQFLRQEEFNEEQGYANHMRRRLNYALFEDGVVQIATTDLTIAPVTPGSATDKRIRIRRGMAVGANQDLFESREIILHDDSAIVDLAASFVAGNTVWATVNYRRLEAVPVAVGSSTANSRFDENAEIRFSATNPAGQMTAAFDPFIILGSINFDTMVVSAADRQTARLRTVLFAPAPSISFNPTTVTQGAVVTMVVTSGGGFNLTGLVVGDLVFQFPGQISAISIIGTPTATSATIRFTVAGTATVGTHDLRINRGATSATDHFTVTAFVAAPTVTLTGVDAFPGSTSFNAILVINGTNFTGAVSVRFNNGGFVKSTFTGTGESLTATRITLRVPGTGVGTGTLTITAAGGSVTTPSINIA